MLQLHEYEGVIRDCKSTPACDSFRVCFFDVTIATSNALENHDDQWLCEHGEPAVRLALRRTHASGRGPHDCTDFPVMCGQAAGDIATAAFHRVTKSSQFARYNSWLCDNPAHIAERLEEELAVLQAQPQ